MRGASMLGSSVCVPNKQDDVGRRTRPSPGVEPYARGTGTVSERCRSPLGHKRPAHWLIAVMVPARRHGRAGGTVVRSPDDLFLFRTGADERAAGTLTARRLLSSGAATCR